MWISELTIALAKASSGSDPIVNRQDARRFVPDPSSEIGEFDAIEGLLVYDNKSLGLLGRLAHFA